MLEVFRQELLRVSHTLMPLRLWWNNAKVQMDVLKAALFFENGLNPIDEERWSYIEGFWEHARVKFEQLIPLVSLSFSIQVRVKLT